MKFPAPELRQRVTPKSKFSLMGLCDARLNPMYGTRGIKRGNGLLVLELLVVVPDLPVLIFYNRDNFVDDAIQGRAIGILQH
jgi:hypothetical protein